MHDTYILNSYADDKNRCHLIWVEFLTPQKARTCGLFNAVPSEYSMILTYKKFQLVFFAFRYCSHHSNSTLIPSDFNCVQIIVKRKKTTSCKYEKRQKIIENHAFMNIWWRKVRSTAGKLLEIMSIMWLCQQRLIQIGLDLVEMTRRIKKDLSCPCCN